MLIVLLFSLFFATGALAVSIAFVLLFLTSKTKRKYTIRSFFFPFKKENSLVENLGAVIVSPFAWIVISICIVILFLFTLLNSIITDTSFGFISYIFSGIAAYFFSSFYLLILYYTDFHEREPPQFIISLFLWGIASALFSLIFSLILQSIFSVVLPFEICLMLIGSVGIAPLVEEIFKSLGVVLVILTPEVDNALDGALYGGTVGLGFAFIENWIYFTSQPITDSASWIFLVLLRGMLSTLGHLVFTGTTGAVLAWLKFKYKYWWVFAFPLFIIGIVLHAIFNFIATLVEAVSLHLTGCPIPIFLILFLFTILISFAVFYVASVIGEGYKNERKN
ncbi:PrsW family intramembrane metalloprotease [Candidatus Micrarchaeota archaeon]|jgi:RsiW-degrading membrane proteinase PrsW (M82 family)|nr:PrsW family intramembrane metalloprotease [Candidatus Micrarchaeota archaeon]